MKNLTEIPFLNNQFHTTKNSVTVLASIILKKNSCWFFYRFHLLITLSGHNKIILLSVAYKFLWIYSTQKSQSTNYTFQEMLCQQLTLPRILHRSSNSDSSKKNDNNQKKLVKHNHACKMTQKNNFLIRLKELSSSVVWGFFFS